MKVWKKQTIRYRVAGQKVPKGMPGAQQRVFSEVMEVNNSGKRGGMAARSCFSSRARAGFAQPNLLHPPVWTETPRSL